MRNAARLKPPAIRDRPCTPPAEIDIILMEMYIWYMIKTQISLPDQLYRDLKRLALAKEWSLAETLRRGAERLLEAYPPPEATDRAWRLPRALNLGWKGLTPEQLKEQTHVTSAELEVLREKGHR